jgi:hypothetical protein
MQGKKMHFFQQKNKGEQHVLPVCGLCTDETVFPKWWWLPFVLNHTAIRAAFIPLCCCFIYSWHEPFSALPAGTFPVAAPIAGCACCHCTVPGWF